VFDIYSLTESNKPFYNFPPKCGDIICDYIYVIDINSKTVRRGNCPFDKNYFMPIPHEVLSDVYSNRCKIVINYSNENFDCVHSNTSDLTRHFINNTISQYNLSKDQIILITGNLKSYKSVPYTVCSLNKSFYTLIPLATDDFIENQNNLILSKYERRYKVMCLMNVPRTHRIRFAHDIFFNNLRDGNLITCKKDHTEYNIKFFNATDSKYNSNKFVESLPWIYDLPATAKSIKNFLNSEQEENLYLDSYVNFVVETYLDHTSKHNRDYELDLSEKVSKPISRMQPFVVLGQEGILDYLRSEGYKTFDRWWDESYDLDLDSNTRYNKVWKLFTYINSLSKEELSEILTEMQPILEHNRLLFEENVKSRKFLNEFNETVTKLFDK
jgi:hypothetical protein